MTKPAIVVAYTHSRELAENELANISHEELLRAGQFKADHRRQQFLCGRALLRHTLQLFCGESASSFEIVVDARGKPGCMDGPELSIAHTGDLLVCAVTQLGRIGIDIEIPRGRQNVTAIAKRYFSADEAAWLATQAPDRFYMLWVLKEAWLKAKGSGIAGGLDRLSCFVSPPVIDARISGDATPTLSLHALDNTLVGVATDSLAPTKAAIYHWDFATGQFEDDNKVRLIAATR